MRDPFRPSAILLLSLLTVATHAQEILVVGVKRVADCDFATRPLIRDLQLVRFPANWTIVVACNLIAWDKLRRKADAQRTDTGFTNIQHHITVLNGLMYREAQPLHGTAHDSPRLVLKHEYGHILCGCDNELMADHAVESKIQGK